MVRQNEISVFIVYNGKLHAPPYEDDILVCVTRNSLIHLSRNNLQVDTSEGHIVLPAFLLADQVFV